VTDQASWDELIELVMSEQDDDTPAPRTLDEVRAVFTRWLGGDYDLTVLEVVLAVAASEQLSGDSAWLLVVSGPGAAKTETVLALKGAGASITSTITSEGALLSGTSRRERSKEATGGLLRKLGARGVLVIKDVTSILSMNRDARAQVLAALREVYDGMWERNIGTDGGQTLTWAGRLVVIGAVTTAWDSAHSVVSTMGDRFLLVRLDSTTGRVQAGRHAIRNTGDEEAMRAELADVVGRLLATVDPTVNLRLTDAEEDDLLRLADVVTLARTGVERDYQGNVIDAHAPEMPTRFAKQLTQVVRGALALSMPRDHALALARSPARAPVKEVQGASVHHVHGPDPACSPTMRSPGSLSSAPGPARRAVEGRQNSRSRSGCPAGATRPSFRVTV
jgi:hypothetical protein